MPNKDELSVKLAGLLLLEEGELSVSDIEALPFVGDYELARAIADELVSRFDAIMERRKMSSSVISQWEDFVRLKHTVDAKKLRKLKRPFSKAEFEDLLGNARGIGRVI